MMAEHADGLLLVAMAGRTPISMIRRMKGILAPVSAKVAGAIVNNATEGLPYYYDYSYYGYKPLLSRRDRKKAGGPKPDPAASTVPQGAGTPQTKE
jgi:Mrp family chromosome partitioning ATPase